MTQKTPNSSDSSMEKSDNNSSWIVLSPDSCEYPHHFKQLPTPPKKLFLQGNLSLLHYPMLAIVGSRYPTPQGKRDAFTLARDLSLTGYVIVSGLAKGIDASAHEGGLQGNGKTIAIMGTGIDKIYPPENLSLAHRIIAEGGMILSEFEPGTPARSWHFPHRNRLIAALSEGCLVIEATLDSGSLITANWSLELGKEIFARPGSIHSPQSKGCHRLIQEGAKLVESREDILRELPYYSSPLRSHPNIKNAHSGQIIQMTSEESYHLWQNMGVEPESIERLAQAHALTLLDVSSILTSLEIAGLVARLPGGLVQKLI